MSGLDREMHAKRQDELLAEQDTIEWRAGFGRPMDANTRRFSGAQTEDFAMNWMEIHDNWDRLRPLLRSYWGRFSEDDLKRIQGDRPTLAAVLQERYGYVAGEAEKEIARFEHEVRFPGAVK